MKKVYLMGLGILMSTSAARADVLKNQFYTPAKNSRQSLDLYLPLPNVRTEKTPLLLFVPGGAWVSGDKSKYVFLGESFRAAGWAVAIMNYRYSDDKVHYPAAVQDCAAAIEWLGENQPSLKNLYVVGHSAGAHTAAVLALDGKYAPVAKRVLGFVGIEGIYDVPLLVRTWPEYKDWFVQITFGKSAADWEKASPQRMTAKSSPWLVVHSSQDELVDPAQSKNFHRHLVDKAIPADLFTDVRENHFGVIAALENPQAALFQKIVDFAARHR